jgi:hypothetical protein
MGELADSTIDTFLAAVAELVAYARRAEPARRRLRSV